LEFIIIVLSYVYPLICVFHNKKPNTLVQNMLNYFLIHEEKMSLSLFGRYGYTDQDNKRVHYKETDDKKRDTKIHKKYDG